ncbi:MAG: B12-binding domain-containing radical SAM protein [Solirubrobacteraceae bacterium]
MALVTAELEENLGLRYIASSLEAQRHAVEIVPFNTESDAPTAVERVMALNPQIVGLSMIFTSRAREFCALAEQLREVGYHGHIIGGGPFASFNCELLVRDYQAFDSIALGEGEELMCKLAENLSSPELVNGLCCRSDAGEVIVRPAIGNPDKLDELPWPKRTTFHSYFGQPIASVLTSRGYWRACAFCSINAWYERGGGHKFRVRSVDDIVGEVADLYQRFGVRIFNFQDDNFFLPNAAKAAERFRRLADGLRSNGVTDIAIAVKVRPDTITEESISILDELGLFRVFLGVENASEHGLHNLNRKNTVDQILQALRILNDFDVHIAYNLLMFEPDTTLSDLLINLRFMERHIENPFNFCRAEAYPGTGLEQKLLAEGRLLGDAFGYDYRLKDPRCEAFHQIANYAFFDRNFSDFGLHYFNMQVDFYLQLLRRFYPVVVSQQLRATVRNFIKETNLDTYERCSEIYDFVEACSPTDELELRSFARSMRLRVDRRSRDLLVRGQRILNWLEDCYTGHVAGRAGPAPVPDLVSNGTAAGAGAVPGLDYTKPGFGWENVDLFGVSFAPVPYEVLRSRLSQDGAECALSKVAP